MRWIPSIADPWLYTIKYKVKVDTCYQMACRKFILDEIRGNWNVKKLYMFECGPKNWNIYWTLSNCDCLWSSCHINLYNNVSFASIRWHIKKIWAFTAIRNSFLEAIKFQSSSWLHKVEHVNSFCVFKNEIWCLGLWLLCCIYL